MGYTPTVWETGDIVTSEKLNKIENGIANAEVFYIQFELATDDSNPVVTCNHTPEEIIAAKTAGKIVLADYVTVFGDTEFNHYACINAIPSSVPDGVSGADIQFTVQYADVDQLVEIVFGYGGNGNEWYANINTWVLTPEEGNS